MILSRKKAPIAVFTYKRPKHTERLLRSLLKNPEVHDSQVFIYSDGPKSDDTDLSSLEKTRETVKRLAPSHAIIIERDKNRGLAASIIEGVTNICADYGKVVVLEDDLELSPATLGYFNKALELYQGVERVMHIAAYMYPVEKPELLPETFFYQEATCWGWATWKRAWELFEPDPDKLLKFINDNNLRSRFDKDDTMYFYRMLTEQKEGKIDSWAIRWYSSIFMNNGLSLHPAKSFIQNTGNDRSGSNCRKTKIFLHKILSQNEIREFTGEIQENEVAAELIKNFRKNKLHRRSFLKRFEKKIRLLWRHFRHA